MKHLAFPCLFLILASCSLLAQTNPVPFISQPLVPETAEPGSSGFTLQVHGAGFAPSAVVEWNGSARPTQVLTNSLLQATIKASDVQTSGTARVTVVNLGSHNETSNVAFFTIRTSAPTVAMIPSPSFTATGLTAVGDFNNDGKLDIVVLNPKGIGFVADVYLGKGKLEFQPPIETEFTGARNALGPIFTGDFDGDHNLDVAVMFGHGNAWAFAIMFGDGKGKFRIGPNNEIIGRRLNQVYMFPAGDLNGDGKLDLIIAVPGRFAHVVSALFGDGHGKFSGGNIGQHKLYTDSVVVGDFNEDGHLDVALVDRGDSIEVAINQGDGTFPKLTRYAISPASFIAVADVNGDGHLDLITNRGEVLFGKGNGTFAPGQGAVFSGTSAFVMADFNGDGKLDMLFPGSPVLLLIGNGDGTFQSAVTVGYNFFEANPSVGSFKPDGHLGLVGSGMLLWQVAAGLYPPLFNFGSQNVGTQSQPQTATLVNAGSTPLPVTQIGFTGTNAEDFSQTNNCPDNVAVGGSCQIQVTFAPQSAGDKTAALTVAYTGPGSPQSVALSGTGVAVSTVSLTPQKLKFATRIINTTSAPKTVTLSNTGSVAVNISSIAAPLPFSQTNNCPTVLPVGQSCMIRVTFRPTKNGVATGKLSVTDDALNSPQTVALSGTGTTITFSPIGVNFGNQKVGTTSDPVPVTLSNGGTFTLNISQIKLVGMNPGDFSETNDCGSSVPAGGHCTFQVTFTPTKKGQRSAKIQVFDDVEPSPQEVALGGAGT